MEWTDSPGYRAVKPWGNACRRMSCGCPSAALLDEIARSADSTKRAYTDGLLVVIDHGAARLTPDDPQSARVKTLSVFALMVGTLQVSRMGRLTGNQEVGVQDRAAFWSEACHDGLMNWGLAGGIVASLIAVWLLFLAALWIFRPRDVQLGQLVRIVPDVLRLVRQLIGDGSVPFGARAALVGLLVWLINPIDLIPEFIPVLGPLDDVVVAVLVLRYVRRRLGDEDLRRRWPGTPAGFELLSGVLGAASAL